MVYKLTSVDYTEEMILNTEWPNKGEPATGWRRFRIEYKNADGYSNIEGTLYFPPGLDPYPILDTLANQFSGELSPPTWTEMP